MAFLLCSQPDSPTCQGSFHLSSLVTAPLARAGYPSHGGVSRVTKLLSVLDLYLHGPLSPKARDAQEDQPCPVAPRSPALIRQVRGGRKRGLISPEDAPGEKSLNSIPLCFFFPKKSKTLWSSARVFSSRNSAVEKNSIVLKEKESQKIYINRKYIAGSKKK